ncbi:hypothetical protein [Fodinibius sediminis]|uniref:SMP-30/Gluconolaconase/LRE-like region-containing protein n=1 Tax=Fodinibius sediminis TaxID=1214077 RepID=A0A521E404_9BACT|nr:hypothetical protein [Fodinibius sediminis]SMO78663.1 hypothetical protein SAMN06265218_11339 [Fodinibius sediminis]
MKQILFIILAAPLLVISACSSGQDEQQEERPGQSAEAKGITASLSEVWTTGRTELITPECATFDPEQNVFYISNLNRDNNTEDDGYISIVNADGTIENAHWTDGLGSPLGNDFHGDYLYVSDNGQIVQIDRKTGAVSNRITIEGASDLNGIDIAGDGTIYTADSDGNKIFRVTPEGEAELILEDEKLNTPNGVHVQGNQLLIASSGSGSLLSLDLKTSTLSTLVPEGLGQADGIIALEGGHFLVSSWSGEVYFINSDMQQTQPLLDTSADSINAADIGYIPRDSLLVVPTFYDNRLVG